jgi:molybdopterin-synthase adenylyltransferase
MITIVGVGALGSHVALFLRNEKSLLRVIDFDRVEMKNTQAQFHSVMSLGKNKAAALEQALRSLFKTAVMGNPVALNPGNALVLLRDADVVLDCTDNIQARRDISVACKELKKPLLHGALSAAGDFGRVVWEEHFIPDAEGKDAAATCVDGEHLPFFAYAGAVMALEVQFFLKKKVKRSWQLTPGGILRLA